MSPTTVAVKKIKEITTKGKSLYTCNAIKAGDRNTKLKMKHT